MVAGGVAATDAVTAVAAAEFVGVAAEIVVDALFARRATLSIAHSCLRAADFE